MVSLSDFYLVFDAFAFPSHILTNTWQLSKALTTACTRNSYPLCLLYISLIKLITWIVVFNGKRERQNIINTGFQYINKSTGYTQHTWLSLSICWVIAFSMYWGSHFMLIIGQSSQINNFKTQICIPSKKGISSSAEIWNQITRCPSVLSSHHQKDKL